MDSQLRWWVVAAVVTTMIALDSTARAAALDAQTVIQTKKMCPVCAKKIVESLRRIEGVAEARADIESKVFVVLPVEGHELSPRALWETVEHGGEQPTRLTGPSGTFKSKPKF